ncbi:MAG: hypothetical protein C4307_03265 [Chloroflexota bacterium]
MRPYAAGHPASLQAPGFSHGVHDFRQSMRIVHWLALVWMLTGVALAQTPQKDTAQPAPSGASQSEGRTLTIDFKQEGERWWWVEDAEGKPLTPPQKTTDTQTTLRLPKASATAWVLDAKTGNMAQVAIAEQKDTLTLTGDRWSHVARLQVNIRKGTLPVASAVVTLTDSKGQAHIQVLEPTAEGIVMFERVPLGRVTVKVQYGSGQTVKLEMPLARERDQKVPVLDILVRGTVATVVPSQQAKAAESQQAPTSSLIGTVIMSVVAGVLAISVILLLIRLAKQKEQPITEVMQKLGVELPTPSAAAPPQGNAPSTPPPPDLPPLDTAGVPPTAPLSAAAGGVPTRLVGTQGAYIGTAFALEADLITVGREVGNGIVLDQEATVSRRHAQFVKQGDTLLVEDLGSTNGTFVNGVRISGPTPVRPGDVVQFGACAFRVE